MKQAGLLQKIRPAGRVNFVKVGKLGLLYLSQQKLQEPPRADEKGRT